MIIGSGPMEQPQCLITALGRLISDGLSADICDARQRYFDALHIPAASLVLDRGTILFTARNPALDRVVRGPDQHNFTSLMQAVADFFASGAERQDVDWCQQGVGGRHFRAQMTRLPPFGAYSDRALLSLVDRTAEVQSARSLRAEMLLDSLTGLPNRLAFDEAMGAAIDVENEAHGFAVLAIDLARFSRVNECIGSLAGDELILTAARRLVSALGPGDMLARLAGDEFGVIVRGRDGAADPLAVARRLQASLATPIRLSDLEIHVDCAIGCALSGDLSPNPADILRNAQVALKRAKASRQVEVYQPGEVNVLRRRFTLETDLRRAIERDSLSLAFQPLVDLESGVVSGFEALARWDHPDHGPVAPTEFIAVAEDSGLIVPLGRWALDAAARTLADWDAQDGRTLPIRMCVNLSPVQLARDAVTEAVTATLAAHGIGGDRLMLELTESSIIADPERANRVLRSLHDLGCSVAMDDFGTGYSSLAYLQRLPIDILKIDRSFVTDMHENRDSVAIIRAILSLAHTLGMSTTAEGIETIETARTLAALGCTTGQGYHFARPLPAAVALDHFRARSA